MKRLGKIIVVLGVLCAIAAAAYALSLYFCRREQDEYITLYDSDVEF